MLYLVATPIGNLADFSYRAVEVLNQCDYILCEDTRHSARLLQHYQIKKKLKSYHQFNEKKSLDAIIDDLKLNLNLALLSDAGTPILCDPGYLLVERCRQEGIPVTSIGGPCAALLGLICSGFNPIPFQFVGFLPKKTSELHLTLTRLLAYEGTSVAYEAPHRIEHTLRAITPLAPHRYLCIARELTKWHEESLIGTASDLLTHFKINPPKGEMVLIIKAPQAEENWSELSLTEHVSQIQRQWDLSLNEAIKRVAEMRGLSKRTVYQAIHHKTDV